MFIFLLCLFTSIANIESNDFFKSKVKEEIEAKFQQNNDIMGGKTSNHQTVPGMTDNKCNCIKNKHLNELVKNDSEKYKKKTKINDLECDALVHKKCINKVIYTDEELENVRLYLAQRFRNTNPLKPICKRLYVRKDVKCLTNKELSELIDGLKELYRTGVYDKYSWIHANNWGPTHKFAEAFVWHRWHIRQLEKELQKINPRLSMPYWDAYTEFAAPERSSIWNFLGTAGNSNNSFCIPDGAFAYTPALYPTLHCIKRQWNTDGSVSPWEPPEWLTSIIQTSKTWNDYGILLAFTAHFKVHLSVGGYYGDFSIPWATNDPLFYIYHVYIADLLILKWQLSDDSNLVPQSYTGLNRFLVKSNRIVSSNIETDVLVYYTNTRVKETFQVGFGDLCYIHDQLIQPINNIIKKIDQEQPIAVRVLMESLPRVTFRRYFPKFADNTATPFDNLLINIGECLSARNRCKPIPIALPYNATANGWRQLERLRFDSGIDITPDAFLAETRYYSFMNELRENHYCSPYVT